jgi:predicted dehydrogenase
MINIGIIGYGYWGPNVARNFYGLPGSNLVSVCDLDENRLIVAKAAFPGLETSSDLMELIKDDGIQAVAIVTPVSTHFELAKACLERGKHIFVEKPFTASVRQAEELIDLARRKGLIIMVDHTFLFTGAVQKIKEVLDAGELGDLFFYDSVRVNLGLYQHDVNVVWDLAPHDFSIMSHVVPKDPVAISALSTEHFGRGTEDVAFIAAHFDNGFIAHFHCNWLSPVKIRRTLISGNRKMLVWDDLAPDEKIKIYDRGVEIRNQTGVHELLVSYRSGDMYAPKISSVEALQSEARYFLECIEKNQVPFNDGEAGLKVVRMLEAADRSMKLGGEKIKL